MKFSGSVISGSVSVGAPEAVAKRDNAGKDERDDAESAVVRPRHADEHDAENRKMTA